MKGISPLIAGVILVAITVSMGAVLGGWFSTFTRETTSKVGATSARALDCASSHLNIEDVYIMPGATTLARAIVKNSGLVDGMEVVDATLYNRTGGNFTGSGLPIILNKGMFTTITFENVGIVDCPADFSEIIVGTSCGGIFDTFDGTPKCA